MKLKPQTSPTLT